MSGQGARALAFAADVTVREQVERLVDGAVQGFGRIDVMINNAGLMSFAPLERLKVDEWDRMIDVNLKGVLYGVAAALPHMQRQMSGQVINVSSVAGHKLMLNGAVYSATKHAVGALSEGLRQEIKPWNIRTTVISPGAVDTELPGGVSEPDIARGLGDFYAANAISADSFARARWPSPLPSPRTWTSTRSCSGRPGNCPEAWRCGFDIDESSRIAITETTRAIEYDYAQCESIFAINIPDNKSSYRKDRVLSSLRHMPSRLDSKRIRDSFQLAAGSE